jgi:hypothetical protein
MVPEWSLLVALVLLVDGVPLVPRPSRLLLWDGASARAIEETQHPAEVETVCAAQEIEHIAAGNCVGEL